jgi:hypothetical protein
MRIRRAATVAALAVGVGVLSACGGGSGVSHATEVRLAAGQKAIDELAILAIERKWHDADTTKNLAEMMSLWAPSANWQLQPGQTLVGKPQIRNFWLKQGFPLSRKQHWFSDTATFRIRTTVDGNHGTLYFECHEIDRQTKKVVLIVGQNLDVAKIGGRWLITKSVGSSPTLGA